MSFEQPQHHERHLAQHQEKQHLFEPRSAVAFRSGTTLRNHKDSTAHKHLPGVTIVDHNQQEPKKMTAEERSNYKAWLQNKDHGED